MLNGLNKEAGVQYGSRRFQLKHLSELAKIFFIFSQNPSKTSTTSSFTFARSRVWILHVKTLKKEWRYYESLSLQYFLQMGSDSFSLFALAVTQECDVIYVYFISFGKPPLFCLLLRQQHFSVASAVLNDIWKISIVRVYKALRILNRIWLIKKLAFGLTHISKLFSASVPIHE